MTSEIARSQAKKIIGKYLKEHGLSNKLTAKTVNFVDLARDKCVFVEIHNWQPGPMANELIHLARTNGFCVEFHIDYK